MADQIEHTVRDAQELKELLSNRKLSFLPREGKIKLLYDHLSEEERHRWEGKLSRYYFEYGCNLGSKSAIIFLFLYLIFLFGIADISSILEWQTLVYGIVFVVIGAVLEKIFGIVYNKYLLNRAVEKIVKRAEKEPEIL